VVDTYQSYENRDCGVSYSETTVIVDVFTRPSLWFCSDAKPSLRDCGLLTVNKPSFRGFDPRPLFRQLFVVETGVHTSLQAAILISG